MNSYIEKRNILDKIKNDFNDMEIVNKINENHYIITTSIQIFLKLKVKNWKYNRPPDMVRVKDIAYHIYNNKKYIETIFFISYNNINETYEIIDGIHRYSALCYIKNENSSDIDYITSSDFGSNNDAVWLYTQKILLNIRYNANDVELMDLFINLNKSISIPEIYIRNETEEKKIVVEDIVNKWYNKYPTHFSIKIHTHKPNINRTQFTNLISKLYDKHNITKDTQFILENMLDNFNNIVKNKNPQNSSISALKKCNETNCYIFLYKTDYIYKIL